MKFSRDVLSQQRTWALFRFKKYHTELNSMYWSWVPVADEALSRTEKTSATTDPAQFFGFVRDARRVPHPLERWGPAFKAACNWIRLNALLGMVSYLDEYVRTVVALALESDPGLLYGAPSAVDGVRFLKRANPPWSMWERAETCVKGQWSKRIAVFRDWFGRVPAGLGQAVGDLEQMRRLRNRVGHEFGRQQNGGRFRELMNGPMQRLSEAKLQGWLSVVEDVATDVDRLLGPSHIGDYETIKYYHTWAPDDADARVDKVRAFKKSLGRLGGLPLGLEYCRDLIRYYDKA